VRLVERRIDFCARHFRKPNATLKR
jgi:hypothetical protein